MSSNTPAPAVGARIGRYEFIQRLGPGAFGELWVLRFPLADESVLALGRLVQLQTDWDDVVRQALGEAAWDSMELAHDRVLRPADVVFDGDCVLLVCDYVEGQSLCSLLDSKDGAAAAFPVDIALRIVVDAIAAVDGVHAGGALLGSDFSFGGIAPESLFVSTAGDTRLLDALVAGVVAPMKGSPYYAAPEQDTGAATQRSDVFALGCLMWELLSNRQLPRAAKSAASTAREPVRAMDLKRRPPGQVSPALIRIVERATEAAPEKRFRSTKLLLAAIEAEGTHIADRKDVAAFVEFLAASQLHNQRQATEDSKIASLSALLEPARLLRPRAGTKQPSEQTPAVSPKAAPSRTTRASAPRPAKLEPQRVQSIEPAPKPVPKPAPARTNTLLGMNVRAIAKSTPGQPAHKPRSAAPVAAPMPHAQTLLGAPVPDVASEADLAAGALPPLPPLAPPPRQGPVSMLFLGGEAPRAAVKSLAVADAMSFEDDLRELSDYVGERYSEVDSDPLGEEKTRADVRFDDLMQRDSSVDPSAEQAQASATEPGLRTHTPAPVARKARKARKRVALWIGGAALVVGFGATVATLSWLSDDEQTASAERPAPAVPDTPIANNPEVSALPAPSATATEPSVAAAVPDRGGAASADPVPGTGAMDEPPAPAASDDEAPTELATQETESAAETEPVATEKPLAPRPRRVTKPRSQKRKKKQFVPSGL